jgi:Skp family chaperone for outer membrane proteins
MMSAAADRTRVASGEFAGAQTAYDDAFKRPLNLPRMPIPEERSMAGIGIPSLLANLATAISGNPLYQQVQQGRFAGEDEERRQAQQQNLQLSREETVQRRQENLQHMHDRMALAADRLQAAEKYEEEIKMRGEMAKVQEKIQGMEGDQAKERAEIQAKAQTDAQYIRLKGVFAKQGYDLSIDENGEWQIAGGGQAASTIKLKRSERMERVQGWGKIAAETKDPKKAQFAKLQMAMAVTMPDDDDKNWNGLFTRATRELEQIGVPASEIDMLLHAAAFENAGKLPGAAEYYKRIDDALNARKKTGGGKETKETKPKENDFLDKIFGPRSPEHEAWRAARREAIGGAVMGTIHAGQAVGRAIVGGLQSAGGALGEATTMSAEEHASSNVENAQKQVDNLEGLMKRYPEVFSTSDTVAALADAYKQLAKAKKDMEVIKNKGETPKKAQ